MHNLPQILRRNVRGSKLSWGERVSWYLVTRSIRKYLPFCWIVHRFTLLTFLLLAVVPFTWAHIVHEFVHIGAVFSISPSCFKTWLWTVCCALCTLCLPIKNTLQWSTSQYFFLLQHIWCLDYQHLLHFTCWHLKLVNIWSFLTYIMQLHSGKVRFVNR